MESARKVPDEVRQILAEVCAEYRVRIDADDPAVAMLMVNRLVLELALNRAVERIDAVTAALNSRLEAVQVRIGAALAQELRSAFPNVRGATEANTSTAAPANRKKTPAAVVAAFALGMLVGLLIRW